MKLPLTILLCMATTALGATWYAAPGGLLSGDGSLANPWPLTVALASASIQPGDVLYLRGGTYNGPGYVSTLEGASGNYITVSSYPNEWAIVKDGAVGTLGTAMIDTTANALNIVITNSAYWPIGNAIQIGNERLTLANTMGSATNWMLFRGAAHEAHSQGDTVYSVPNVILIQNGSYTQFRNFEITTGMTTNRTNIISHVIPGGMNLSAEGHANKLQGLFIHDVGQPGIGPSEQGDGGEINGCLIYNNGKYDFLEGFGGLPRGSGIYGQNASGQFYIKNCITFRNFTAGAKIYGETGPVHDSHFIGNIAFDNTLGNLQANSGSTATSNIWFVGNIMLNGGMGLVYVSIGNVQQHVLSNIVVNASMTTAEHTDSEYQQNTFFVKAGALTGQQGFQFQNDHSDKASLNITWDNNTYYFAATASIYQYAFKTTDVPNAVNSAGGGYLRFNNDAGKAWTDWATPWDANSTYTTSWPTDYLTVTVQLLDWDANRWHVAVVNTTAATSATLNLASACGFTAGQRYQLKDAQNPFVAISYGVYSGSGTITLPLNLTAIAAFNGVIQPATVVQDHTNVAAPGLFNAFVLERLPGDQPVQTRRHALTSSL